MVVQSDCFIDLWKHWTNCLEEEEVVETTITARLLWVRRNEFIDGKGFRHLIDLYKAAKEEVFAYRTTNIQVNTIASRIAPLQPSWQKPIKGF